jgi:hypothetical protein
MSGEVEVAAGAEVMSEHTKADLDAMTDRSEEILRDAPFAPGSPQAAYAQEVAGLLAVQFPGVPELSRITLACAHYMSAVADAGLGSATLVHVLGEAGLRIGGQS